MSSWVATHVDLIRTGALPAKALVPDAAEIDSITVAGSIFELRGHGFGGGENVRFAPRGAAALPTGIASPITWYEVAPTSDNDFFTCQGLTIADSGTIPLGSAIVVIENWTPKADNIMAAWTSYLVARAIAYQAPWMTPPAWGPTMVSFLAAPEVTNALRIPKARYETTDIHENRKIALDFIETTLAKGGVANDGTGPVDANAPPGTYDPPRASGRPPMFCRTRTL